MKKIFFLLFFTITTNIFAQKVSKQLIAEYEDTLKVMAHKIMNADSEEERRIANNAFTKELNEVLQYQKAFDFPFDSLITISIIKAPDNTFRIFNWLLRKSLLGIRFWHGICSTYELSLFICFERGSGVAQEK